MKKILYIALVLFLYNTATQAQILGERARLGLYVLPNPTWFNANSSDIETTGGFGFGGGIVFDYALDVNNRYWLGSGVGLTSINGGTQINADENDATLGSYDAEFRIRYFEIPLTIKMKTNEVGYFTYFGQAGFTLGIPLNARYDLTGPPLTELTEPINIDNEKAGDLINPFNSSLSFGGGLEFAFTETTSAYGAIIYNQGFSRLIKKKSASIPTYVEDDSKITGSYIGFRLGLMF